jgi:excisionase family DNA binding protein
MSMPEQLWTVDRLAEFLATSSANTYSLIERDRIPGIVRLGPRAIRVDPDAVKSWVEAGGFAGVAP